MAYREKRVYIKSKNMVIVQKGFSARIGKKVVRSSNTSETCERQKKINQMRADERRSFYILENFNVRETKKERIIRRGDRFITLTYKPEMRPGNIGDAHKIFIKLLRKIKRKYPDCKYIGKTEMPPSGAVHHHFFINRDVPHDFIVELWGEYNNHITDKEIYSLEDMKLTDYFIKNINSHKCDDCKYTQSRNLVKPIVKTKIINANTFRKEPKAKKGYTIISYLNFTDVFGFDAQKYVMVRRC